MNSFEQKARDWLEIHPALCAGIVKTTEELATLLKEQDRDTRHACADAVTKCVRVDSPDSPRGECVILVDAFAACMNARPKEQSDEVRYGCTVEGDEAAFPDCVIDKLDTPRSECSHALANPQITTKEQCGHWVKLKPGTKI